MTDTDVCGAAHINVKQKIIIGELLLGHFSLVNTFFIHKR